MTHFLVFFLPVVFLTGLAVRQPAPVMTTLPREIWPAPSAPDAVLWDRDNQWPGGGPRVRLWRDGASPPRLIVEFSGGITPPQPDVLAYWVPPGAAEGEKLATSAVLLGSIGPGSPRTFALPESAPESGGRLVLYSLANGQIISTYRPLPGLATKKEN